MSFKVVVKESGEQFFCDDSKSILQAALDSGIALPFSCRSGMCLTCRGRVVEGQVSFGGAHEKYLSLEDRANGLALFCCAKPLTDLVIDVPKVSVQIVSQQYPVRVLALKPLSPDVMALTLGMPPNQPLYFRPGQFVDFLFNDGVRRSYSIATMPRAQGVRQLDFHVRHMPGGYFTDRLFNSIKVRDMLQIEAPLGSFYLQDDDTGPIVFLASGTGFAPIKSMLSVLAERKSNRQIYLYWGGRQKHDLYDIDAVHELGQSLPHFTFVPVLSEASESDSWQGRTGFVHRAVMQDHPDLSGVRVYACGAPVMVEAARADFTRLCGLSSQNFLADSFITEAEKASS
jgi:CDP-4-dehydro-6-deoxyglucose reductase